MKKFVTILLTLMLCVFGLTSVVGCKDNDGGDDNTLYVYTPDGAPALAMSKLLNDNNQFGLEIDYSVVASSNISNYIINKSADIAVVPVNMASKILGNNYKIIATVTNGNLYIVGNVEANSLADLTNEVVGVIGQGNVPDLNLKYLLSSNSIEYVASDVAVPNKVALRYFADAGTLIPMLKNNQMSFGLLPEPAVSKLIGMANNFSIKLNIQSLWESGAYPQAVIVAKTELVNNNSELIESMIEELEENEQWAVDNPVLAVNAVNAHLEKGVSASLQNTISSSAIQNCNIDVISAKNDGEKQRIIAYWEKIKTVNANAIGEYSESLFW